MKYLLVLIFISTFLFSCKDELQNVEIINIDTVYISDTVYINNIDTVYIKDEMFNYTNEIIINNDTFNITSVNMMKSRYIGSTSIMDYQVLTDEPSLWFRLIVAYTDSLFNNNKFILDSENLGVVEFGSSDSKYIDGYLFITGFVSNPSFIIEGILQKQYIYLNYSK